MLSERTSATILSYRKQVSLGVVMATGSAHSHERNDRGQKGSYTTDDDSGPCKLRAGPTV